MAELTTFIDRSLNAIRLMADEPEADVKYSDDQLIQMMESSFQKVLVDLNAVSDTPLVVRHNITFVNATETYMLPPSVERVIRIAELDSATKEIKQAVVPGSRQGWLDAGVRLEGRVLRLAPKWQGSDTTFELQYIPNGDIRLHYGLTSISTSTTATIAGGNGTVTKGTLDKRPNAYVGSVFRVVGQTYFDYESTITSHAPGTYNIEYDPSLTGSPSDPATYEIIPIYGRLIEHIVQKDVACELAAISGNEKRYKLLMSRYVTDRRALRLQLSRTQGIVGDHFEHRNISGQRNDAWGLDNYV